MAVALSTALPAAATDFPNVGWLLQRGSVATDYVRDIEVDTSGNVYMVGLTLGALPGQTHLGFYDAFVSKFDKNGAHVWTRQFGTSEYDDATAVVVTASEVIVAGTTSGVMPGATSVGQSDGFLARFTKAGTRKSIVQFGSAHSDSIFDLAVAKSGAVYVAGDTTGTFDDTPRDNSGDALVAKLDKKGALVWARRVGAAATEQFATAVAVSKTEDVYLAGGGAGAIPGQVSAGGQDAFVVRWSKTGTPVWTNQFGTAFDDVARGMVMAADGDLRVSGTTRGTLGAVSAGVDDAFITRVTPAGSRVWTTQVGTSGADVASRMCLIGTTGAVAVAGWTSGNYPGFSSLRDSEEDAVVMKVDAAGFVGSVRQFVADDTQSADGIACRKTNANGGALVVGGSTRGPLFGFGSPIVRQEELYLVAISS